MLSPSEVKDLAYSTNGRTRLASGGYVASFAGKGKPVFAHSEYPLGESEAEANDLAWAIVETGKINLAFQRGDKDENTRYVRHYTALEDEEFIIVYGGEGPHLEYNITQVDSDELPSRVHQIVLGALTGKILVEPEQRRRLINFESMPMLGSEEVCSLALGSHGDMYESYPGAHLGAFIGGGTYACVEVEGDGCDAEDNLKALLDALFEAYDNNEDFSKHEVSVVFVRRGEKSKVITMKFSGDNDEDLRLVHIPQRGRHEQFGIYELDRGLVTSDAANYTVQISRLLFDTTGR